LTYIKDKFSDEMLETASVECWKMLWQEERDISKPEIMQECLSRNFSPVEVGKIMQAANSPDVKSKLLATTDAALEMGAYGSPWFMVTNAHGEKEPFFGSDRYV
jgi:glutathione S-transferase kappa 1